MKIFGYLILICFIFLAVLFKSNTFETRVTKESRGGVEYVVTKQSVHWDRFYQYVKDIPAKTVDKLRSLKASLKR